MRYGDAMRSSPWSLAVLMLFLGVVLVYFGRQAGPVPPTTWVAGGALVGGGLLVLARVKHAYWAALGAGIVVLGLSVASFVVRRELVPTPIVTVAMGLLVIARVFLARSLERRERE